MVNEVVERQAVFLRAGPRKMGARTLLGNWCHPQSEDTTDNLRAGALKGPATFKNFPYEAEGEDGRRWKRDDVGGRKAAFRVCRVGMFIGLRSPMTGHIRRNC
jgi:hypothetical protein